MSIDVKLNEGLRRASVTVLPGPQTKTVADAVLGLTTKRPALGGWDWIIDIRNPHVQATLEEIESIAAAFNAATSQQSYTIFISNDPGTYDRCALLGPKFVRRRHLVATSMAEALSLLPINMQSI
ncbi:hypothetical protein GCM10009116_26000 [Brevundimonas basaltis]|uniref:Uncharacterized protein n=1 Tax=Brevundimonas basaltis TaxID=472166 RepID=A0A7W8MG69_9CAUL|nr:hypothetical protein [Brevundimonas basaltis]MBB5291615.1 hypothetical protein [Brevundimonas basaltis]